MQCMHSVAAVLPAGTVDPSPSHVHAQKARYERLRGMVVTLWRWLVLPSGAGGGGGGRIHISICQRDVVIFPLDSRAIATSCIITYIL